MKKVSFKKIFNIIFLVAVFGFTVWSVFRGEDLGQTLAALATVDIRYIILSVACVILFILGEAVGIHYLLRTLGTRTSLSHCCLYSFIGFFYSCLTPSASGGQPMQIVNMRKDGIPVAISTVVLAIITITYKLVLVLIGAVVLILRPAGLMVYLEPVEPIVFLGMGLNVICIAGLLLLVFCPGLVQRITNWVLRLLNRFHLLRDPQKQQARMDRIIAQYEGAAVFYRSHKGVIVNVFLITFAQRAVLFFITWFTYLAFDQSGHSMSLVVTLQAMISVAADMLPLPGGMGISETLFLEIFHDIFGEGLVLPAMVVSRGLSYYTQLLLSGVMTVAAMFILGRHRKKGRKNL